jgi:hypothetical protein
VRNARLTTPLSAPYQRPKNRRGRPLRGEPISAKDAELLRAELITLRSEKGWDDSQFARALWISRIRLQEILYLPHELAPLMSREVDRLRKFIHSDPLRSLQKRLDLSKTSARQLQSFMALIGLYSRQSPAEILRGLYDDWVIHLPIYNNWLAILIGRHYLVPHTAALMRQALNDMADAYSIDPGHALRRPTPMEVHAGIGFVPWTFSISSLLIKEFIFRSRQNGRSPTLGRLLYIVSRCTHDAAYRWAWTLLGNRTYACREKIVARLFTREPKLRSDLYKVEVTLGKESFVPANYSLILTNDHTVRFIQRPAALFLSQTLALPSDRHGGGVLSLAKFYTAQHAPSAFLFRHSVLRRINRVERSAFMVRMVPFDPGRHGRYTAFSLECMVVSLCVGCFTRFAISYGFSFLSLRHIFGLA